MKSTDDELSIESGEMPVVIVPPKTATQALVEPVETHQIESHHIEPVPEQSSGLIGNVKLSDFVKIFVGCTEIAELSAEQVKRIRESKFILCFGRSNVSVISA